LTHTGFDVFIPNSLTASFLRSLCSTSVLKKVGAGGSGDRNFFAISSEVSQIFPHFALHKTEREKSCRLSVVNPEVIQNLHFPTIPDKYKKYKYFY
jgi:hypothetical protein